MKPLTTSQARLESARPRGARRDMAQHRRHGTTRQVAARTCAALLGMAGTARPGNAGQARLGAAGRDLAKHRRHGVVRRDPAQPGIAGRAWHGKTRRGASGAVRHRRQGKAGHGRAAPGISRQPRARDAANKYPSPFLTY